MVSDPSIGVNVWGSPGNATASDDVKAFAAVGSGAPTQYLKATGFGFSIPASAVIRGIEVAVERNSAFANAHDNAVRIVKGGAIGTADRSIAPPWTMPPDAVTTYGGASDLWGESWTAADINGAGFGAAISATDGVSGDLVQVDHIAITVSYSLCGDTIVSPGEQCDDGNTNNGDCCSSTCQFESSSVVCRPVAGACDVAESCTGTSGSCPADGFESTGTICRAASTGDVCDETEVCTGSSAACPGDGVKPSGFQCRSAAGVCDVAEVCDGVSKTCPSDGFASSSVECRAAVSECDVAENCTGASAACPADVVVPAATACADDGNPCTTDVCDGSGACTHPPDPQTACELIPGRIVVVKPGKLVKFVSKSKPIAPAVFPIPVPGSTNDPTLDGATLRIFDTSGATAGDVTYDLPSSGWKGLGNPPGVKGYKYKGRNAVPVDDTCKIVLVKEKVIKAVCKGAQVTLTPPFAGPAGIVLDVGSASIRYCAEFGGQERKNDVKLMKRKDAPTPAQCSDVVLVTPTYTVVPSTATATATGTASATATATDTATAAATATETATGAATATETSTATQTATVTLTATQTPTQTPTETPTVTPVPPCPLTPGAYTLTQTSGGTLKVSTFAPFAFPTGGTIVQDVGAASAPACVHDTVVPFPGGFSAPAFCVPALGYSVHIDQTGCGVGKIDSNGGSDFTVIEHGDTSDASATCSLPNVPCSPGVDASIRVDVTVGDSVTDVCTGSGTANAIVSVPVFTTTWLAADSSCPDTDGTYNAGTDTLITGFPQILDFTTDTNTATFVDIDGDGCSRAGSGPNTLSATGACMDIAGATVKTGAAGTIGSSALPYDITFSSVLPNAITGPAAPLGATCASPPIINFTGSATRCIP